MRAQVDAAPERCSHLPQVQECEMGRKAAKGVHLKRRGPSVYLYLTEGYYTLGCGERTVRFHRFLWALCHRRDPVGLHIHHRNGNRLDNRSENLEAMTPQAHGLAHAKPVQ